MKTRILRFDPASGTLDVRFSAGTVSHRRQVNACLDAEGGYDKAATARCVAEVARGVAAKIAAGTLA